MKLATASNSAAMLVRSGAFDLAAPPPGFIEDPWPLWHALRELAPVYQCPDGSWLLTRHADLDAVYRSDAVSSDKCALFAPKFGTASPLFEHHTTSLVFNDPPLHTRVRTTLLAALRPSAIQATVDLLTRYVESLLEELADRHEFDLIEDYASRIPVEVISSLLRVPPQRREHLRQWSLAILGALEPSLAPAEIERGNQAVRDFLVELRALIDVRRSAAPTAIDATDAPADRTDLSNDVLLALLDRFDAGEISETELLHNCIFLLNAGHETTTNLIGNGVHALLTHPRWAAAARTEGAVLRRAIEETLRWASPNQIGNREVIRDVTIGEHRFTAGDQIVLAIGAANRDPAVFDDPDVFRADRSPNPHLAFATGVHACAGASLARIEGRIAIGGLLRRYQHLTIAGTPQLRPRMRFRGFDRVPLTVLRNSTD